MRMNLVNLPNFITIGRIGMVPVVIFLVVSREWMAAFVLFALAGVSDAVDGFIAKRWNMTTELGALLDPIADKALLVSIYVSLTFAGALPAWLVIAVVFRDVLIVSAVVLSLLLDNPIPIKPLMVSKANTVAQIVLAALVLAVKAFGWPAELLVDIAIVAVALLTTASVAAYLAIWLDHMTA